MSAIWTGKVTLHCCLSSIQITRLYTACISKYIFYVLQNTYVLKGCPLLAAASQGHDKCIELLLETGADPEGNDDRGYNCIMLATEGKHWYIDAVENTL